MGKIYFKKQKPAIIFLIGFFIIVGLLIILDYYQIRMPNLIFLMFIWVILYIFVIKEMIENYRSGWFPKRLLLGPTSSFITIKKHPLRWKINLIFWNIFYLTIVIYLIIQIIKYY